MAWVIEFFYKESKMYKKRKKYIFCFLCWGGGGFEGVFFVFFFYKESKSTHFLAGGMWNGRGSVARR